MKKVEVVFNKLNAEKVVVFVGLFIFIISVFGCVPNNNLPEIISLETGAEVIGPSESCFIECLAHDQDGDMLTYNWTADEGRITNTGQNAANIAWMAPKAEGLYSIMVMVLDGKESNDITGNDVVVSESITIRVKDNHAPVITELVVDPEWILLSDSCQLELSAEDQDGDELIYEWMAEKGKILGRGQTAEWTAPNSPGLYEITIVVSDGFGKETTRTVSVSVSAFPPPVIKELVITAEEPKYLKEKGDGYMILRDRSCEIKCVIEGMSGPLTYEWSDGVETYTGPGCCGDSSFTGEGATINWTAPDKGTEVTVSVYVYDEVGNVASKNIVFKVETCTCAFK